MPVTAQMPEATAAAGTERLVFDNNTDRGTLRSEELESKVPTELLVACAWEHDSVLYNHFPVNHLCDQAVL